MYCTYYEKVRGTPCPVVVVPLAEEDRNVRVTWLFWEERATCDEPS